MSHGLTDIDTMFSVRELPWHGLGTVLDAPPSIDEALRASGLAWSATMEPAFTAAPYDADPVIAALTAAGADPDTVTRIVAMLPDFVPGEQLETRVVRRSDHRTKIGEVGPGFRPLDNADALGWFSPLIGEGLVTLETAGSLHGGSRVWVMARLTGADPVEVTPGDEVAPFLLLAHGHDGKAAIRCGLTPVRVVCQNTLTAAVGRADLVVIRHTLRAADMLADARDAIRGEIDRFAKVAEGWRFLASRPADDEDLARLVRGVFGSGLPSDDDSEDAEEIAEGGAGSRVLGKVRELWEAGRGARPGTWWTAYNAVTEYLTHERGRSAESRFAALHFGEARKLGARALSLALHYADRGVSAP